MKIKNIIIHWSASGPQTDRADFYRWHVVNQGWRDIGYHRIILHPNSREFKNREATKTGHLMKTGRHLNSDPYLEYSEWGAHTLYKNRDSIGICVVGGPKHKLHPLQKQALLEMLDIFIDRYQLPKSAVMCHRDFNPTQCPGDEIYKLIQEYKAA